MTRYTLTLEEAHELADLAGDKSGSIHDFIQGEGPFGNQVEVYVRKKFFRTVCAMGIVGIDAYPLKTRPTMRFMAMNFILPEEVEGLL